jgi:hypothetical protein
VHADSRTGVDVELAVYHDVVSRMNGHIWREAGVVVDLENIAGRDFDFESFMSP